MDDTITVKIHDVLHDAVDFTPSEVEAYIEKRIDGVHERVEGVRIAKGHTNSPLYVELDANALNFRTIKHLSREAVRLFGYRVDGVDVQATIRDGNLKIENRNS